MIENENLKTQGSGPDRPTSGIGALEEGLKEAGNEGSGGLIGAGVGDEAQGEVRLAGTGSSREQHRAAADRHARSMDDLLRRQAHSDGASGK